MTHSQMNPISCHLLESPLLPTRSLGGHKNSRAHFKCTSFLQVFLILHKLGVERSLVAPLGLGRGLKPWLFHQPCPSEALPEGRTPILVDGLDLVEEELVSKGHRVIFGGILTLGCWIEGFGSFLPECHLHNNKTLCSVVLGWEELWEREVGVSDLLSNRDFLSLRLDYLFMVCILYVRYLVFLWQYDLV